MPSQNIHVLTEVGTLEELYEAVALFQKQIKYLINGQMDVENIRAKSLTAEVIKAGAITADEIAADAVTAEKIQADAVTAAKIDVDQLSAISANLGTITAGLMQAVTIIGSYIATANGTYPRSEMDVENNMFAAYLAEDNYIRMRPNVTAVQLDFVNELTNGFIQAFNVFDNCLLIGSGWDIRLAADNDVRVPSWGRTRSDTSGEGTLQSVIDALTALITAKATAGSNTSTNGTHNHGIPDGTQLLDADGVTVHTFVASGNHSHTQT